MGNISPERKIIMFGMFGKNKTIPQVQIDFRAIAQIKGYNPDPANGRAYVFVVEKLQAEKVLGLNKDLAIRVAIASAELDDAQAIRTFGRTVVLIDKDTAKLAKWPWSRTEVLAMIAAENAVIFDQHEWSSVPNTEGFDIEWMPQRAAQLLDGGVPYGWGAARKGANRQNKVLDKSLKPIVKGLHKNYKKGVQAASRGDIPEPVADPFQNASDTDIIEEVIEVEPDAAG